LGEKHEVDAELRERVIAGDGGRIDNRNVDHGGMLLHILRGLPLEIGVQSGNPAGKGRAVVVLFVEQFN
jgi:hypothetical protein